MRNIFSIALLLLIPLTMAAQEEGTVTLNQPAALDSLVYKQKNVVTPAGDSAVKMAGYRVQIYSSNRAQTAKSGAFEIQQKFSEAYPDIKSYVSFSAPFWKVRVGDFITYAEALQLSRKLQTDNPDNAPYIFVVKEEAVKPLYLRSDSTAIEMETELFQ